MGSLSGAAEACDFLPLPHVQPYHRDKTQGAVALVLPVEPLNCFPPALLQ